MVLIVLVPIDFGVLLKSNAYPEVKVAMAEGVELTPERDPEMESKLWLLRENSDEILLHAIYVEKARKTGKSGEKTGCIKHEARALRFPL